MKQEKSIGTYRKENNKNFSAVFDNHDRLLNFNKISYQYNPNGDLSSKTENGITTFYNYDSFGNLRDVNRPGFNIEYDTDHQGRRVAKRVNGTVVARYAWQDQLRLAAELDGSGNLIKQFVYADGVNSPDYMIYQGKKFLFSKDHRGSITMVVDSVTGEMKQKIKYSDWGEVLEDTNPGLIPFGYAGGIYDQDTELVRFGARDYDPQVGRWLAKDPIRFNGRDTNLYGYTFQDPVNFVDETGLTVICTRVTFSGVFFCSSTKSEEWKNGSEYEFKNEDCFFICKFTDEDFKKKLEENEKTCKL